MWESLSERVCCLGEAVEVDVGEGEFGDAVFGEGVGGLLADAWE